MDERKKNVYCLLTTTFSKTENPKNQLSVITYHRGLLRTSIIKEIVGQKVSF